MRMEKAKEFFRLFAVFFKIGASTFGGGLAMLPVLEREFVQKRKWISQSQLYDYYTISQSSPGIVAVNVATFTGYERLKIPGAVTAAAAVVCPALIIITIIAAFFETFSHIVWIQKALSGINVSVSVMVSFSLVKMAKRSCIDALTATITIVSFLLMLIFSVQGIFIVLLSSAIGILVQYKKAKSLIPEGKGKDGAEE